MAYGHKAEYRLRLRAQVVLHAARGRSDARIARETGLHLDTVRRWRGRFAVHEPGRPGHGHRALRERQARVLDRRQRLLPPRQEGRRPAGRGVPERGHGPHPCACLLAEPGGDLPLRRPAQGGLAQRLHRPGPGQGPAPSLRRPLQRHGTAVPAEVHHLRPGRSAGQTRPAHRRSPARILRRARSLINPRRAYEADHLARDARPCYSGALGWEWR
ncbi:hypothetical protein CG747_21700 [Streptomyces sp. CB02959]|nr:hypothetical protein CG747_21700 [Streptomyces sp. CB02959]